MVVSWFCFFQELHLQPGEHGLKQMNLFCHMGPGYEDFAPFKLFNLYEINIIDHKEIISLSLPWYPHSWDGDRSQPLWFFLQLALGAAALGTLDAALRADLPAAGTVPRTRRDSPILA